MILIVLSILTSEVCEFSYLSLITKYVFFQYLRKVVVEAVPVILLQEVEKEEDVDEV